MTGDSAPRTPGQGARLKLSREMKLVLALLLLLALLGAWFVWTGNRAAAELAQPETPQTGPAPAEGGQAEEAEAAQTEAAQPPTAASSSPATGTPEPGTNEVASGASAPVEVAPGGQVEVPVIPPFGTLEDPQAAGAPAEAIPAPGGINPDTALAALPVVNPFRPLALEEGSQTPEGQISEPSPAGQTAPIAPPAASVAQASPPDETDSGPDTSSGPLALSPLPGTAPSASAAQPVNVTPPRATGGAFPTPTLPGVNVAAPVVVKPGPSTPSAAKPSTVRVTRPPTVRPATQPSMPAPVRALPAPTPVRPPAAPVALPAPARPPVAGVQVPPTGSALNSTLAAAPEQASNQPGTPAAATSASATATALPTPGTPQPITQLGADGSGGATTGPLGTLVQARDLAFDAVVLGPVNTAILRSKDGFVVVAQGQTLPDSDVVVREISAQAVTLELGPETQTLELDRPNPTQGEP